MNLNTIVGPFQLSTAVQVQDTGEIKGYEVIKGIATMQGASTDWQKEVKERNNELHTEGDFHYCKVAARLPYGKINRFRSQSSLRFHEI